MFIYRFIADGFLLKALVACMPHIMLYLQSLATMSIRLHTLAIVLGD